MNNKFENFVKRHREEFDAFEPSGSVWLKIEAEMQKPSFMKSKISWLKYFAYGASVIAVLIYFVVSKNSNNSIAKSEDHIASLNVNVQENVSRAENNIQSPADPESNVQNTNPVNEKIIPAIAISHQESLEKQQEDPLPSAMNKTVEMNPIPAVSPKAVALSKQLNYKEKKFPLKMDTVFSGIKTLEINSAFDVNIRPDSTDKVAFKADIHLSTSGLVIGKPSYKIEYERKDDVLKIIAKSKGSVVAIYGGGGADGNLFFEVPKSINIIINNSFGNINARGLQGKLYDFTTEYGDINIEDFNTNLKLKSTDGNIKVMDTNGDANINSSFGNITLKNYNGNPVIIAQSGDVKITDMTGNAKITSSFGNVILENYKGNPEMDLNDGNISGKNVELVDKMIAKSSFGNIKMGFVNNISDLSFDLKTEFGKISIEKDGEKMEQEGRLVITKGKILVKGITSDGNQVYE